MDGRLLVVEDDPQVRAMLSRALGYEGFEVVTAATGAAAMAELRAAPPELMLLDLLLPDEDGMEVCRRVRAAGEHLPILMLTARDTVSDRIAGLEAGADDYLVKPFSTAELVARVRALLRRARDRDPGPVRRFGDLTLDSSTHEVHRGGRPVRADPARVRPARALPRQPRRRDAARAAARPTPGASPRASRRTRWTSTSATCGASSRRTASPA